MTLKIKCYSYSVTDCFVFFSPAKAAAEHWSSQRKETAAGWIAGVPHWLTNQNPYFLSEWQQFNPVSPCMLLCTRIAQQSNNEWWWLDPFIKDVPAHECLFITHEMFLLYIFSQHCLLIIKTLPIKCLKTQWKEC